MDAIMTADYVNRRRYADLRALALTALIAILLSGCAPLRELVRPTPPGVTGEWAALLEDIRAFTRRIGFEETDNFADLSEEQEAFPVCGYVSRFYLPYSYEDPAIRWVGSVTEQQCRELAGDSDVYFSAVEALGESATPVTPAMVTGKLDRFLYLVIHEDCHDQFELPWGIEEALCNLITYRAMEAFAREKYRFYSRENRAIRRYADLQSRLTRTTIAYYEKLATLYARHGRREIPDETLLRERAAIYREAERALGWKPGELNNVAIANDMTYSRHYPFLESVYEALGKDLARIVEFFRRVDERKPTAEAVKKRYRISDGGSAEFIRTYEGAVIETIRNALAESDTRAGAAD
jgi:hypothetical protein